MSFSYPFNINIRDLYQFEVFLYKNGYQDIAFTSNNNGITTINYNTELDGSELETLTDLVTNVYTNPYPSSSSNSNVSLYNSSTDLLSAYQSFEGMYEDISEFSSVSVLINSNQSSLRYGIEIYFSTDGISHDFIRTYTYVKNNSFVEIVSGIAKYFKIVYKNGGNAQSNFTLQTIYHIRRHPDTYSTTQKQYIRIDEEDSVKKTRGHFRSHGFSITATANATTTHDFTFPYDIAPLIIKFKTGETHRGDVLNLYIAPNVVVGVATQNIVSGNNYYYVTPSSLDFLEIGYSTSITNGIITEDLGDILDIDYSSSKITVQNTIQNNFNSGAFVRMSVNPMRDYIISEPGDHRVGDSKIGATYIPKNNIVRFTYENNSNVDKVFAWQTEMLY